MSNNGRPAQGWLSRHSWLEPAVLAIAVAVAFGAVVPDYYQAADDLMATGVMNDVGRLHDHQLSGKLYGVLFKAEGQGHFRPVQDLVYVLLYEAFGPERWIFAVMLLYAACHFASGGLLAAILRRLGAGQSVAFVAGLLFVLHPVWDENLASVQFGNNVPGLATVLGACLLWLPKEGGRPFWRLAGACFLLFLATGIGVNLMASGALLLGLITLVVAVRRRSWKHLLVRGAVLAVPLAIALAYRKLAYGALGTAHPTYQKMEVDYDLAPFGTAILNSCILLKASPMAWWHGLMNPPGVVYYTGEAVLWSIDGAICLLLAIALGVVVASMRRGEGPAASLDGVPRLKTSFWFGVAVLLAMMFPYYAFVGRISPHRYVYPSVAGLAVIAATTWGLIGRGAARRLGARMGALIAGLILAAAVFPMIREDREAARSIAAGHRVTRAIVQTISDDLTRHPEVRRVFAIGFPRMLGRAGHTIVFPSHLPLSVNAIGDVSLPVDELEYQNALDLGLLTLPLPDAVALYLVDPDGTTVTRVQSGREGELPDYARLEGLAAIGRNWGVKEERDAMAGLLSTDQKVVDTVLRILVEAEGAKRQFIIQIAVEQAGGPPLLQNVMLELCRREGAPGMPLASRIAVRTTSAEVEKAAMAVLGAGNPAFTPEKYRGALELERKGRELSRTLSSAAEAHEAFTAAVTAWKEAGIPRDDLWDSISFSVIAGQDDAQLAKTRKVWASQGWERLLNALDGLAKSRTADLQGVRLELIPRGPKLPATKDGVVLDVMIHNDSATYIPGAVSPLSARLVWSNVAPDGTTSPAFEQWLPAEGAEARNKKEIIASVPIPATTPPPSAIRVDLVVYGKPCATATWPLNGSPATAQSAEKQAAEKK